MLSGYKTYFIALTTVLYAVGQFFAGNIDLNQAITMALAAAGAAGLRAGVASEIRTAVASLHLLDGTSSVGLGARVATAIETAKKVAPLLALCFGMLVVGPALVACSTASPATSLAASETVVSAAQSWWITNCVQASNFSFCSDPATKATVKDASATATAAAQTATDAVESNTLDAATIAQLVADANADATALEALVARLQGKK